MSDKDFLFIGVSVIGCVVASIVASFAFAIGG